jgi:ferredoxin-fold anticodon binding domain-containing protein
MDSTMAGEVSSLEIGLLDISARRIHGGKAREVEEDLGILTHGKNRWHNGGIRLATLRFSSNWSRSLRRRLEYRRKELGVGAVVARQGRGLWHLFIGLGGGDEEFVE